MPPEPGGELGALLRHWRAERGLSQMALADAGNLSQRHLSYIESGRARPSAAMVGQIAAALALPLRERNALLVAAGYAPRHREEAPGGAALEAALGRMLRQQEPYPALLLDRWWNVRDTNAAAPRFFGRFADLDRWPRPRNLLRLLADPAGLRPHLRDWPATAAAFRGRIRREAVGRVLDAPTRALLAALDAPDAPPAADPTGPLVPLGLTLDGTPLDYFSLVTTVGTPLTVAAEELRLESLFPADAATEQAHAALFPR